jgi:hypothetical protein
MSVKTLTENMTGEITTASTPLPPNTAVWIHNHRSNALLQGSSTSCQQLHAPCHPEGTRKGSSQAGCTDCEAADTRVSVTKQRGSCTGLVKGGEGELQVRQRGLGACSWGLALRSSLNAAWTQTRISHLYLIGAFRRARVCFNLLNNLALPLLIVDRTGGHDDCHAE